MSKKRKHSDDESLHASSDGVEGGFGGQSPPFGGFGGLCPPFGGLCPPLSLIFAFLTVRDVGAAARVCHEWHRVLAKQTPCLKLLLNVCALRALVPHVSLVNVQQSVLAKHFSTVNFVSGNIAEPCELYVLSTLPNVTAMDNCTIARFDSTTVFPAKLVSLDMTYELQGHHSDVLSTHINTFIRRIGSHASQLTSLRLRFDLTFTSFNINAATQKFDFTPLYKLHRLTHFSFVCTNNSMTIQPEIPSLVDFLQGHSTIRRLDLFIGQYYPRLSNVWLKYIVRRPPVCLDRMNLRNVYVDETNVHDLQQMSTLKSLNFASIDVESLQFLSAFPQCTHLRCRTLSIPIETLVDEFKSLSRLTSLELSHNDLTSDHLATLLSHLPNLKRLTLFKCPKLTTLAWAGGGAAAPNPASGEEALDSTTCNGINAIDIVAVQTVSPLTALTHLAIIDGRNIDSSSIDCLFGLKSLVSIEFTCTFDTALDGFSRKLFTPPSRHFQKLKHFKCVSDEEPMSSWEV